MPQEVPQETADLIAKIAERLEAMAESAHKSRELMDSREAAEFLRLSYDEFRRLAPNLPRHPITEKRFRYSRRELLEWALSR